MTDEPVPPAPPWAAPPSGWGRAPDGWGEAPEGGSETPDGWGEAPDEPTGGDSGPPPVERTSPPSGGGRRPVLLGALIGALVGALVAGGLVAALGRTETTTIVRSGTAGSGRPATVVRTAGDIRAILDRVQPAVVRIDVSVSGGTGTGTGFIVDADGVIVTNAHVVSSAEEVTVTLDNGDRETGRVLGADANFDLAVVRIDRTDLPTVELGDSDALQVGDAVVAIGDALGLEGGSGPSVTSGIVSGLDRQIDTELGNTLQNLIQTDAAINPGNSGGPLVNADGQVVAINTAIANPGASNNVGFAIAISSARPILEAIAQGRTPSVAFLGVETETVTPDIAERRDLAVDSGAYVAAVTPDSPAAAAGLRRGDVIVELDGTEITRSEEVARAVRRHEAGDSVAVVVDRAGTRSTLQVELAQRPTEF